MELFNKIGGCCPFCGNKVNIVEGMVYNYNLNEDGTPEYLMSEEYKIGCYCKYCCKQLYAVPNSKYGYSVYPYDPMSTSYASYDDFRKDSRFSILGNMLIDDENPFINTTKDDNDAPWEE